MTANWQDLAALALVGLAAVYLLARAVSSVVRRRSSCGGGCAKCPTANTPVADQPTIVRAEDLAASGINLSQHAAKP